MANNDVAQAALRSQARLMTYNEARASVAEQEGNFAKGAAAGVATSVVRAPAALGDLARMLFGHKPKWDEQVKQKMEMVLKPDEPAPGWDAGFDAGNVIGDVSQIASTKASLIPMVAIANKSRPVKTVLMQDEFYHQIDLKSFNPTPDKLTGSHGLREVFDIGEIDELLPGFVDRTKIQVGGEALFGPESRAVARLSTKYDPSSGEANYVIQIRDSELSKMTPETLKATLVHEIQHGIQREVGSRSRGTAVSEVEKKLVRIFQAKKLPVPDNRELRRVANVLYMTNFGEQEAELAARLATERRALEVPSEVVWKEDTLDELWNAYQNLLAKWND